jgi:hypothetical protein
MVSSESPSLNSLYKTPNGFIPLGLSVGSIFAESILSCVTFLSVWFSKAILYSALCSSSIKM